MKPKDRVIECGNYLHGLPSIAPSGQSASTTASNTHLNKKMWKNNRRGVISLRRPRILMNLLVCSLRLYSNIDCSLSLSVRLVRISVLPVSLNWMILRGWCYKRRNVRNNHNQPVVSCKLTSQFELLYSNIIHAWFRDKR